MSTQRWLKGEGADPIYFVYRDGEYLGTDPSLEAAQRRADYREKAVNVLRDTVDGKDGMPAFLALSEEERAKERAKAPPPAPRRARLDAAATDDPALKKAIAERDALTSARATKKAERKAAKAGAHFDDDAVISVTVDKNPRKPGTGAHDRFQVLMDHSGKTFAEYKAAKGNLDTLENAIKDGRVSVATKE